jgi:flavin-dependent dehydrogenase
LPYLRADYLVVGAGPAGLTVARLLSLKGRKVTVVDPELNRPKRLELLAPVSLGTIAELDLTPLLEDPTIARPCLGIRRRWDSAQFEFEDFLRHPQRTGYVVDRTRFDARLRAAAVAAGVELIQARLAGIDLESNRVCLATNGSRLETFALTGTIVDATGRAAAVARCKGARVLVRDRLIAELLVETCVEDESNSPTWLDVEKLEASSWIYRIRGIGGQAQTWRIRRLGSHPSPRALRSVDASSRILSTMAGNEWIAVGDAASAFDPIASQGLFHALSSALVATGALISHSVLSVAATRLYSDAVTTAFAWSEAARSSVYNNALGQGRGHAGR